MMKLRRRKKLSVLLAACLAIAVIAGLVGSTFSAVAAEGTAVSDNLTNTDWETQMSTDASGNGTTENVGRIWTDKSVSTDDVNLTYGDVAGTTIEMSEDADFLVELSALSSTSSMMTTQSTPLDIVLVLDVSGSMANNVTSYTYTEAYGVSTSSTYYVLVNGTYTSVSYNRDNGWYYVTGSGRNQTTYYVTPMTDADDTASGHVQFYTRTSSTTTKLAALKSAVNSFIDETAKLNDKISDVNDMHRISVVKFASDSSTSIGNNKMDSGNNYSQIVSAWNTYTSTAKTTTAGSTLTLAASTLTGTTGTISQLTAAGATRADYGLAHAQTLLSTGNTNTDLNVRADAKKVVIFFTDGEPTSRSSFEASVANDAVTNAKSIKDGGATIYSVAIYSGADASVPTSSSTNINLFLNAVSSNYPSATGYVYDSLGTRTTDSVNYYKVASDANGLMDAFSGIFSEISTAAASPTHVEDASSPNAGGYVTFTDELGSFMEVKDFNAIVTEQTVFTTKSVSATEGEDESGNAFVTTTYTFEGTVPGHVIYEEGDLEDVTIQVVSWPDDPSRGDTVTVRIPATLLPLLYYDVDVDESENVTMDITKDYPLRVFYSVGLKDDVKSAMESGDYSQVDGLAEYVQDETDDDGKVYFYSNHYSGNEIDGNAVGDTTAVFMPAVTNSFYYFQEDTYLYTDEACTIPATSITGGSTYYYKHSYYSNQTSDLTAEGITATTTVNAVQMEKTVSITLPSAASSSDSYFAEDSSGNYYIVAGSARLSMSTSQEFQGVKDETANQTGTASYYLYPTWTGGNNALTYLGNNGRIGYDSIGALSISKTVTADEGLTAPDQAFTFTVTLKDGDDELTGSYDYTVTAVNAQSGDTETVQIGMIASGDTLTLEDGQTAQIIGLPDGANYTVAETSVSGFSATASGDSGTIAGGTVSSASFTNHYSVTPEEYDTGDADTSVTVQKTLTGRSWRDTDEFVFYLVPAEGTTLLPEVQGSTTGNTSVTVSTVTQDSVSALRFALTSSGTAENTAVSFNLGTFTFEKPGTYTYRVLEYEGSGSDVISGVTYSDARYTIVFVVEDNEDGTLSVTETMTQLTDDENTALGENGNGVTKEDNVAAFTNVYEADSETIEMEAYKSLNGSTPDRGAYDFLFTAVPVTENSDGTTVKLPDSIRDDASDYVNTDGSYFWTVSNVSAGLIQSGGITVDTSDIGNTYQYIVEEVIPSGATAENHYTADGITYDTSRYMYEYVISSETDTDTNTDVVVYTLSVYKWDAESENWEKFLIDDEGQVTDPIFYNTTETSVGGEDDAYSIDVTKILTGRDWDAGEEKDSFTFTLTAGSNTASGSIETPMPADATVTVTSADSNYTASFGEITYTAAGTYTYTVTENVPLGATDNGDDTNTYRGITYDNSTVTVTVTVSADAEKKGALYIESVSYNGGSGTTSAAFTNTYKAEETILPSDDGDAQFAVTKTLEGRGWLSTDQFRFILTAEGNAPISILTSASATMSNQSPVFSGSITYDMAGTYTYYITEEQGSIVGITYDTTIYKIVVTVTDDYEGHLTASVAYSKGTPTTAGDPSTVSEWTPQLGATRASFTNTYTADPAAAVVSGSKLLVGRDMEEDETFSFTLAAADDTTKTAVGNGTVVLPANTTAVVSGASANAATAFSFDQITFNETGTYTFTVKEVIPESAVNNIVTDADGNYISYDSHTLTVTVTVTDVPDQGKLAASVTYSGNQTFTNTVNSTKTVADENGNDVDGGIVDVGQALTYTIDWVNNAYDTDGNPAVAEIRITDSIPAGTRLEAGSVTGSDYATITYYNASGDIITDTISDTNAADVAKIEWEFNAAAGGSGTVSFNAEVTEDAADQAISNTATVQIGENQYETNTTTNYIPVTVSGFSVQKRIVDEDGTEIVPTEGEDLWDSVNEDGYWFRFVLEALGNAPLPGTQTGETSGTSADNNALIAVNVYNNDSYTFGDITFTEEGTYVYDLWERSPITAAGTDGAVLTGDPMPGLSYSQALYRVTVQVEFDEDAGVLKAASSIQLVDDDAGVTSETAYNHTDDVMVITNTWNTDEADLAFRGMKLYTDTSGATTLGAGDYTFRFTALNGAPTPSDVTGAAWTVTNAANGEFTSTDITYTQSDEGTHYYRVEEVIPTDKITSLDYDENVYYIKVVVDYADADEDGVSDTVKASYSYVSGYEDENGNVVETGESVPVSEFGEIEFTNTNKPDDASLETETAFGLTKTIDGREWLAADSFSFTLTAGENTASGSIDTPMPEGTANDAKTVTVSGSDAANGSVAIDFGTITYSKVGEYTYTVNEEQSDAGGITIDSAVRTITVTVTCNEEKGILEAAASVDGSSTFTNTYEAEGTLAGETNLRVSKDLVGRAGGSAETFTFRIQSAGNDIDDSYSNPLPENEEIILNASTTEGMTVYGYFGDITFTRTGTYYYTISEKEGDSSQMITTWSAAEYFVIVTVEDNGDGTLKVSSVMTRISDDAGQTDTSSAEYSAAAFTNTYVEPEDVKTVTDAVGNDLDEGMAGVGDVLTYTVTWINDAIDDTGAAAKATVTVSDAIPAGTSIDLSSLAGDANAAIDSATGQYTATLQDGIAVTYDAATETITWELGMQDAGATGDVSYQVTVDNDAVYRIYNTAYVQVGENGSWQETNQVDTYIPYKEEETSATEIKAGTYLQYVITFVNTETGDVEVVDELHDDLSYVSGDSAHPTTIILNNSTTLSGTDAAPTVNGQTLTWNLENLEAGTHVTIYLWVQVDENPGSTEITNQAVVDGHKSNITTTPQETDVEKTVYDAEGNEIKNDLISVGDTITYEISWVNNEDQAAEMDIVDYLPSGTSIVGDSWEVKVGDASVDENEVTYEYRQQRHVAAWTFTAEAKAQGTVTFDVTVGEVTSSDGSILNTAMVNGSEVFARIFAPVKTQEIDTAAADGTLQVGDEITYTVTYHNPANDTGSASDVTVTDIIPDGTELVGSASLYDASLSTDPNTGEQTLTWVIRDVAANTTGTVSFTVRVTEDAVGDTIDNQASVKIGDDDSWYDSNTTTTDEVDVGNLVIAKTMAGSSAPENAVFTFNVTAKDASGNVLTGTYDTKSSTGDTGSVTFDNGTAEVTITGSGSETISGLPEGAVYTVEEVSLPYGFKNTSSANTTGTIAADATVTASFTNTYAATGTLNGSVNLKVAKELYGRTGGAEETFTFRIEDAGNNIGLTDNPLPAETEIEVNAYTTVEGETVYGAFGDITYTKPGSYYYTITEVQGSDSRMITAWSKASYQVTVNVTDNNDGTLNAVVSELVQTKTDSGISANETISDNTALFRNYYENFVPEKTVTVDENTDVDNGMVQVGQVLTYSISYKNTTGETADVVVTDTLSAGLAYVATTAGGTPQADGQTYTWTVTGVEAGGSGTISFTAIVTEDAVTDTEVNGNVTNTAYVQVGDDPIVETNTTETNVETGSLTISKTVEAADGLTAPDKEFTFAITLLDKDGNALNGTYSYSGTLDGTVANAISGTITSGGTISLKADGSVTISGLPAGAAYTVSEGAVEGFEQTSPMNENNEAIDASGTITANEAAREAFTNYYSASGDYDTDPDQTTADALFTKTLSGRSWTESDSFTFEITARSAILENGGSMTAADMPMPENKIVTVTNSGTDDTVSFGFGVITYTIPGTYIYEVSEVVPVAAENNSLNGIAYDTHTATLTVTVTDNGDGTLSAEGMVNSVPILVNGSFTNTYSVTPYTTADLTAAKTLTGKTLEAGEFTFRVTAVSDDAKADGAPAFSLTDANGQVTNAADGTVDFGSITFTEEGVYTYTVSEINAGKTGYSYDGSVYTVTYTVQDNGAGEYEVVRTITKNGATVSAITFENGYEPEETTTTQDGITIGGTKTVTAENSSYTLAAGDFSFTLTQTFTDGTASKTIETVQNAADGSYEFGEVTFTEPGVYTYVVTEDESGIAGISDDNTVYTLQITVTDVDGQLVANVTYIAGAASADALDFTNTYTAEEVSYGISGVKTLTVPEGSLRTIADGEFTFELYELQDDGTWTLIQTRTNTGDAFSFDPVTYTEVGTRTYKVAEQTGSDSTIGYDSAEYTVVVTVTDEGGALKATADRTAEDITFANTFTPEPITVNIELDPGTKEYVDADGNVLSMEDGQFTFELLDADGSQVATAEVLSDGSFVFYDLEYDSVGTYNYTIRELYAGTTVAGVTYDSSIATATVTVTENEETYKLEAEITIQMDDGDVVFTNTYDAADASVTLGASKTLTGATLADGQFTFELLDADGEPVATAQNDADGKVQFDTLTFTQPGTYSYSIAEVNDGQAGVTYDTDVYGVVIVVTDDGEGYLEAEVSYTDGAPVFENSYEPEDETTEVTDDTDSGTPTSTTGSSGSGTTKTSGTKTGDTASAAEWMVILILAAAACTVIIRRRTNGREK